MSGSGAEGTPGAALGTEWKSRDIWLRRQFDLGESAPKDKLRLNVHHDDAAEVYINGVLAAKLGGFTARYEQVQIQAEALKSLQPTGNTIAVHCRQDRGGQYIDAGLVTVEPAEAK